MPARCDNAIRRPADPHKGHVESWFLRANDPHAPRALWLKTTLLQTPGAPPVAEVWAAVFHGTRSLAVKQTVPLAEAVVSDEPFLARVAQVETRIDYESGDTRGCITSDRGALSWQLRLQRVAGPLGAPLCLLPTRRLVDAAIPKNKLLSPAPVLLFSGTLQWGDETWDVSGWPGMQGHNWGPAHARSYAWGQCLFWDEAGLPFAMVEGASGRIDLGGFTTPLLSLLTVRNGDREYRFDRIVDLWRQEPHVAFPDWSLTMRGRAGEATLSMRARPEQMVCLGYHNPDGSLAHCLNSKLAAVSLRVNPTNEEAFALESRHGGALEFLQPAPEPRVLPVV